MSPLLERIARSWGEQVAPARALPETVLIERENPQKASTETSPDVVWTVAEPRKAVIRTSPLELRITTGTFSGTAIR